MDRRAITGPALLGVLVLAVVFAGCDVQFEKEDVANQPPFTFFDVTPADTTFANEAFFVWRGTDLDSDVVAFQYQLVETDSIWFETAGDSGEVIQSIEPLLDEWSRRQTDSFASFSDLADGWYEMRARSIDQQGAESETAIFRYHVFFDDIPPVPIIGVITDTGFNDQGCGRIGAVTSWDFQINASDESRSGPIPRQDLEYRYKLEARFGSCTTHNSDDYTPWTHFPPGTASLLAPPSPYADLFDNQCGWVFELQVRDPARNLGRAFCCITRQGQCS